jgi:hypothetical protein
MTNHSYHQPLAGTTFRGKSFGQLLALYDSGAINGLTFARTARREHRAEYVAYRDERDAAARLEMNRQRADRERDAAARYTDETLRENLSSDLPGLRREAEILLTIPAADRRAVVADAHRFRNATPDAGRWSDALRSAVRHR